MRGFQGHCATAWPPNFPLHAVCSKPAAKSCPAAHTHKLMSCHGCHCRQNYLHARNLREMAALHAQLNRAVMQRPPDQQEGLRGRAPHSKGLSEEDAKGLPAASAFVVQELRRALAAGWADQVGLLGPEAFGACCPYFLTITGYCSWCRHTNRVTFSRTLADPGYGGGGVTGGWPDLRRKVILWALGSGGLDPLTAPGCSERQAPPPVMAKTCPVFLFCTCACRPDFSEAYLASYSELYLMLSDGLHLACL